MYQVVLIDDEIYTLQGLIKTFDWEKYNFNIAAYFTNPVEALHYIERNKIDIVFLDVEMPEISGIELLKTLRERDIKSQIIIVSAHSDFKYAQEAIVYDAFEYLLKPINREKGEKLLSRLKISLDSKSKSYVNSYSEDNIAKIKNERFKKLVNYIRNHSSENLVLNSLAKTYDLNPTYCARLFFKYFNCNFTDYLRDIRMNNACELLKQGYEIADVAEKVGYLDYYHFCKVFKKTFGITAYKYKTTNKI